MQQTLAPTLSRERRPVSRWELSERHRGATAPRHRPMPNIPKTGSPIRWELARLAGSLVEISGTADSGVLSSALALVADAQHNQVRRHQNRHRQNRKGSSHSNQALIAWIATTRSLFFPPDAMESGISLDRLILLRLETAAAQIRAAIRIAHSGAFELVVVDLADSVRQSVWDAGSDSGTPRRPESLRSRQGLRNPLSRNPLSRNPLSRNPLSRLNTSSGIPPLSRLAGLAQKYRTAVVLLTDKPPAAPSLDPRVGKRFDASRGENGIVITVLKDKGGGGFPLPEESWKLLRSRGKPSAPDRDRLPPGFRFERECRGPAGMC